MPCVAEAPTVTTWQTAVRFLLVLLKFQPSPPCSTEIMSILQDSPANCLPLFKLTEIYEKK